MSAMTAMTAGRPRPAVLGQLPTDCACFFRANFFVASAAGAELNQHFHFSEAETRDPDAFREAIILQLGEHAASDEELVEAVLAQIEKELRRRTALDTDAAARKATCSKLWSDACAAAGRDVNLALDVRKLAPACVALLRYRDGASTPADLERVRVDGRPCLERVSSDVWAFELFDPPSCAAMSERFGAWSAACRGAKGRPNSMNRNGLLLDEAGWTSSFSDVLLARVLRPLAAVLFPGDGGGSLDNHRVFTVAYDCRAGGSAAAAEAFDVALSTHFDNAEVTANVNIDGDWEGGELLLYGGAERDAPARHPTLTFAHRRGVALLHRGRELHAARPITSGFRTNLVFWGRSTAHRARGDGMPDVRTRTPWSQSATLAARSTAGGFQHTRSSKLRAVAERAPCCSPRPPRLPSRARPVRVQPALPPFSLATRV